MASNACNVADVRSFLIWSSIALLIASFRSFIPTTRLFSCVMMWLMSARFIFSASSTYPFCSSSKASAFCGLEIEIENPISFFLIEGLSRYYVSRKWWIWPPAFCISKLYVFDAVWSDNNLCWSERDNKKHEATRVKLFGARVNLNYFGAFEWIAYRFDDRSELLRPQP